ncbi:hypothetical protein [Psychroserpens damuponensis]|uniref:hypothetical protein n=1 Tax=Psychroserpens damuponensis TaxID=943936 RepID=UPI000AA2DAB3|nr:hypothetical protein [Psychroserpens damuponensis]
MIRSIFSVFVFVITTLSNAQEIKVNQEDSYKLFVETLVNSKDVRFNSIIEDYDA